MAGGARSGATRVRVYEEPPGGSVHPVPMRLYGGLMISRDREFDIVLFGATGFVGELTAAHLATHAPSGTRIALAGRNDLLEEMNGR